VSRLDSFIRRLQAQRDCLALAARLIADVRGPVLELGLGNGRTFDHLRSLLPQREIFVFDRHVDAHPDCVPDGEHMILGDLRETLPDALGRIGQPAALAHCDLGSGIEADTAALARFLGPALARVMAPGGIVLSDQELDLPGSVRLSPPAGTDPSRYFLSRVQSSQRA
jgi:S-adenosyl-L-methionine methyltransferase